MSVYPHIPEKAISIFVIRNPRSKSWVNSHHHKFETAQHSINSNSFQSMPISPSISDIYIYFKFDLEKSKFRVMGAVQSMLKVTWLAQDPRDFLFVAWKSDHPFLIYSYFKSWPWEAKVKVMGEVKGQSHIAGPASRQCTLSVFTSIWHQPFVTYCQLNVWLW